MGKNKTTFLTLFAILFFSLSGCERDDEQTVNYGRLNIKLAANASVENTITRVATEDESLPNVNDFAIAVLQNNNVQLSWNKYAEYTEGTKIPNGSYTLKATYGNIEDQGFDVPYYQGTENFSIKKGESTDVSVTCYLANVKITTEYTDIFKKYFTDYTVNIRPEGSSDISFSKTETRAAYVKPGKISVYLSANKQQGSLATFEVTTINDARARQHYRLKFDVQAGGTVLNVSFNDDTEKVPVPIDISDEALNTRPPFFTPTGFESGVAQELVEWTSPPSSISTLLTARGGIAKCVLITRSPSLLSKGWPAEVDLANLDPSMQTTLQNFGLELKGLSTNIDKMATLDFTKILSNISYSAANDESTFSILVTDKLNKVNEEPLVLKIKSLSNEFYVAQPMNVTHGSTSVLLTVTLKGDISKVKYQYQAFGYWQSFTPTQIESDEEGIVHQITLPFTSILDSQQIKVIAGDKEKTVTVGIGESSCSIAAPEGDVWAKKATVFLVGDTEGTSEYLKIAKDITIQCKTETGNWFTPMQTKEKDAIEITGLESNTNYTLKAEIRGTNTITVKNEVSIKTEEELQIPNSGFEEWSESKVWSSIGTVTTGGYDIYAYYPYKSNPWWSTRNDKTTQGKASYSWYYAAYPGTVPTNAGSMHTASWHLNKFGGQHLSTDAYKGDVAMEIATIGWGNNSWTSQSGAQSGCDQRTAGALFIGSYNRSSQTESHGHEFSSRPASVHFFYKFYSYNGESAQAYALLEDENRETIGRGDLIISESSNSYKEGIITIDYTKNKTAKFVTIMFLSTNATSPSTLAIGGDRIAWWGYDDSRHIGSVLTVDEVSLEY